MDFDGRAEGDGAVDFIDFGIRDGDAAVGPVDGVLKATEPCEARLYAVNHDVAAGGLVECGGAGAIQVIGIGDVQGAVKAAGRIARVDGVQALGGFVISLAGFSVACAASERHL